MVGNEDVPLTALPRKRTMPTLQADPLATGGLSSFARRLRAGEITCLAATEAYLDRIRTLDPRLGAFEHVAADSARLAARALDALLAAGTDLGPLMGLPIAFKDIIAVDGMPTTCGSNADVADLAGPEGSVVKALRRAGCVFLGKLKTVEFALGGTGINHSRGTPWNPWDAKLHRIPGGSSSGPGVAVAAGLCAFAIGSDTGGSVRIPAAFCGVFGHKTSSGLWPLDGVFPLSPTLDTLGPLTRSAADAAFVHAALAGEPVAPPTPLKGLRLGRPTTYFFDDLDPEVAACFEASVEALIEEGVEVVPVEVPETAERATFFPLLLPAEFIATLGRERFLAIRAVIDPVVAARASVGLEALGVEVLRALRRHEELIDLTRGRFADIDAWITPTVPIVARPLSQYMEPAKGLELTAMATRNTQPGNMFGMCGCSMPLHQCGSRLPVGLQLLMPKGEDDALLALACAVEAALGPSPQPNLAAFLEG